MMMKLAIMQPYLFPYLGYFQLIHSVDRFVVFDDVNFIKKGWVNRNNLLVNEAPLLFTVPLLGASQNRTIKDIQVSNEGDWKSRLLRTLAMSYGKAPCYVPVMSLVEEVLSATDCTISELNTKAIRAVCKHIGISTVIIPSSAIYNAGELKGQERILHICGQEQASHYHNPIGGIELYDRDRFLANGTQLFFLRSLLPVYQQWSDSFTPGLSIIDVLMFNSSSEVLRMMDDYELC